MEQRPKLTKAQQGLWIATFILFGLDFISRKFDWFQTLPDMTFFLPACLCALLLLISWRIKKKEPPTTP